LLRQGQTRQAETYLLKVVQACPATSYAKAAQDRLDRLRDNVANETVAPKPVVRGQSP
jgi:outer membrane protein assembly factor BamD (BamD/ComL family)